MTSITDGGDGGWGWSISIIIFSHFPLYLEGQTQCALRLSGIPIAMVQVSKLYDDLFLRKHILG